jgi:hypothetical protein
MAPVVTQAPVFVSTTTDLNCFKYNGSLCVICSTRFYFNQNGICTAVDPQCKTYDDATGSCTSCYQGYHIVGVTCILGEADSTDQNCQIYIQQTCTQCYMGFYLSPISRICTTFNPLCNVSNPLNGACLTCFPGYTLNTVLGRCEATMVDPNCAKFVANNTCAVCAERYFFN